MDIKQESSEYFSTLLFPKIFQTFRMAIQPSKLIIAFMSLVIICFVGWIMDFSQSVIISPSTQGSISELDVYMNDTELVKEHIESYKKAGERKGVFATLWKFASKKFNNAVNSLFEFDLPSVILNIAEYFKALGWILRYHFIYCIIFFVIKLGVISVAGGSICRLSALQFGRGEKPGLTEAVRFSIKNFTNFFAAPLVPTGIIIFIGLFIFISGLIGNLPWIGELLVGISMPLALIGGGLIAVIAIGIIAGFNLMYPAVAYDGSDCFDAVSRSFSYIYSKPWRMGFYTTLAAGYGAICYTFIRFFAFLLLLMTYSFLQAGFLVNSSSDEVGKLTALWPKPTFVTLLGSGDIVTTNWSESVSAFLVHISILLIVGIVVSFIMSFYFSANTIIYSLMRNKVDGTNLDDVYIQVDEMEVEAYSVESKPEQAESSENLEAEDD